jgi:BolA protein
MNHALGPTTADKMRAKLAQAFAPLSLDVIDESASHAGHAGARPGGETHFHIYMVSAAFAGMSKVARHRAVYAALAEEMAGPVHALALDLAAPHESRQG